ncbi:hypothetical protein [Pantoea ananatis]|uniref:hypothetical protein n=1 Tax=Pantoea ananas TaxID=553 RepID=UPI0023B08843|nr:hypothetical protein [Pantoea ananatis]
MAKLNTLLLFAAYKFSVIHYIQPHCSVLHGTFRPFSVPEKSTAGRLSIPLGCRQELYIACPEGIKLTEQPPVVSVRPCPDAEILHAFSSVMFPLHHVANFPLYELKPRKIYAGTQAVKLHVKRFCKHSGGILVHNVFVFIQKDKVAVYPVVLLSVNTVFLTS